MKSPGTFLAAILLGLLLAARQAPAADSADLGIAPVVQQTPQWCWAAAAEMVLTYYGYPNLNPTGDYQCGIVAAQGGVCADNCGFCLSGGGSTQRIAAVIRQYSELAHALTGAHVAGFDPRTAGILSEAQIARAIDRRAPLLAGITPQGYAPPPGQGLSQHDVVIEGYERRGGVFSVIVNDPYPFPPGVPPPYLFVGGELRQPGQYVVPYRAFLRDLRYGNTILFE